MIYDIAIIGAGVTGCMIARELSMYKLKICLIEKENDVSLGASKANSGIVHAGYDAKPGSLKAKFNIRGCELMEQTAKDLDVPYKKCGSIVAAFDEEGLTSVRELYIRGKENNVHDIYILDSAQTLKLEPNINPDIKGSLYAPGAGIVCPYQLTIAAAENAVINGVCLRLNFKVNNIEKNDGIFKISSANDYIFSKYVINAAGVYADVIAKMTDESEFKIIPRRGEYVILDKTEGKQVNTVIFQPPSEKGKGILVTPTVDGNLLLGPTATQIDQKEDTITTSAGLQEVIDGAKRAVLYINLKKVINSFSGIRATPSGHDFIISQSNKTPGFFNVAGIESPGLTASPAIAEYVPLMLEEAGIKLQIESSSIRTRAGIPDLSAMTFEQRQKLINENPAFGKIICRCENVSEGEIIQSIKRPVGATTVDGVKRRVRAGMGRCQGGFCLPKVLQILSSELNISVYNILKNSPDSNVLYNERGND